MRVPLICGPEQSVTGAQESCDKMRAIQLMLLTETTQTRPMLQTVQTYKIIDDVRQALVVLVGTTSTSSTTSTTGTSTSTTGVPAWAIDFPWAHFTS